MKVLQVTTNYPTQDNPIFGIFMKEQVESLEQFGVENTIFFSDGTKYTKGAIAHLRSVFKLSWHLLTNKYDLIHCHSVISGLILLLSGGAFLNKCIISFQNDPEKTQDGRFFKLLYPFFNRVIVKMPTKYSKWGKVTYLPNGCNQNFFQPLDKDDCKQKLGLCKNKRYILFVDSNTGKKRIQKRKDRFDEVLRILRDKYGYHDLEELTMIGVSRHDVPIYMNSCDLHLLTSDLEGSPNSVKECVFCNIPVVSTNVGNVKDMLSNITGCYVVDSFEPEVIAEAVNNVLNRDTDFIGRSLLQEKGYSLLAVANKLYNLYKEVI